MQRKDGHVFATHDECRDELLRILGRQWAPERVRRKKQDENSAVIPRIQEFPGHNFADGFVAKFRESGRANAAPRSRGSRSGSNRSRRAHCGTCACELPVYGTAYARIRTSANFACIEA